MRVRIGIVTYNRREVLVKAIESALSQSYEPKEIVVLDDASTDDTSGLAEQFPQVEWRRNETNRGLMHARQSLMMEGGHDAYCSLDDDSWFLKPDDLGKAVQQLEKEPQLSAIAFTIEDRGPTPSRNGPASPRDVAWFIGCGHLLRSSAIREIGGYSNFPGTYGCEEKDLSVRLLDSGYSIKQSQEVVVWHDVSFESRPVPKLHASGVCNDLVFDLLRCPIPFLFWQIPKKVASHLLFVIRFAYRSSNKLTKHDQWIRKQWGRAVFLNPYLKGVTLFIRQSRQLLARRKPVSRETYLEFRRRTAFS